MKLGPTERNLTTIIDDTRAEIVGDCANQIAKVSPKQCPNLVVQ